MKRKCKKSGFTPLETEVKISNRTGKRFLTGFTLVELLTVLAIISILVGLLVPALGLVRNVAKETELKAYFATIDQALLAFRSDIGDYPESYMDYSSPGNNYGGAQKLVEALLGRDLLGFNPNSDWTATNFTHYPLTQPELDNSLAYRVGPYLELGTANAFRLGNIPAENKPGLFDNTSPLAPDTFVLCDSFGVKKITIGGKTVKAGAPILYYKADPSKKKFSGGKPDTNIYVSTDNFELIMVKGREDGVVGDHPLFSAGGSYFYSEEYKIVDQKVFGATGKLWPHRADSYILISAGRDGLYGTSDDITNF